MPWAAVVLALVAAFLFAVAAVAQQREAAHTDAHGIRLLIALFHNPRWWAGVVGDTGGYIAQAAALALGSLLIVQPLLVTALLFALPLGARWGGRHIQRRELVWAGALTVSLGVFLIAGNPDGGVDIAPFRDWLHSFVIGGVVLAGCAAAVLTRAGRTRALALAIATGVLYGFTSALTKSVMNLLGAGLEPLLTDWETYVLIVVAITGTALQQMAFQAGSLEISLPAVTVLDPLVASVLGIVALQEAVRAEGAGWVVIAITLLVMVAGTIALARAGAPTPPTGTEAGTAPPTPPPASSRTPRGSPS